MRSTDEVTKILGDDVRLILIQVKHSQLGDHLC